MERPITMCDLMVRALLDPDHPKTMTRRVIKPGAMWGDAPICSVSELGNGLFQLRSFPGDAWEIDDSTETDASAQVMGVPCPYGKVGDRLYVREAVRADSVPSVWSDLVIRYRADDSYRHVNFDEYDGWDTLPADKWRPALFMPRWASRLTLEITGIRVERVQDISEADAVAEGMTGYEWVDPPKGYGFPPQMKSARLPQVQYRRQWDALNAKRGYGWDVNPWVWVIEFRRLTEEAR